MGKPDTRQLLQRRPKALCKSLPQTPSHRPASSPKGSFAKLLYFLYQFDFSRMASHGL